ncbi:MAG: alpha-amylase family glycosyl hydrolase [Bacillota bacterium]
MDRKMPGWLKDAVFYQIYPQSFYDSNDDGIGDIPGITAKLDYIESLGVKGIWINPCFVSPFGDAGYDVADYYKVAPRYGTNADLRKLFAAAAKRGIHVCLDLVPGHTSTEHPWFRASSKAKPNKYTNWYVWTDSVWSDTEGLPAVAGYSERYAKYIPNFFYFQPALNYGFAKPDPRKPWQLPVDHPDVAALKEEIKKIMRFWLDMGASGFRVDMAASLVKKDENALEVSRFWREVREMFDRDYPDAVLISEWGCPEKAIQAGFHMDFVLPFSKETRPIFRGHYKPDNSDFSDSFFHHKGAGDAFEFMQYYLRHYEKTKDLGYISIPSGNHDTERINSGRTLKELEIIFAFLLTMPGVPFIYYGDEIGMRNVWGLISKEGGYNRTAARTPMQWDGSKNAGFSGAEAKKLYLPLDSIKDRPTVAREERDARSLLNKVRAMIRLRRENAALAADGEFASLYAEKNKYPLVYLRCAGKQRFIVALNPSAGQVKAEFRVEGAESAGKLLTGDGAILSARNDGYMVAMNGISYGIFEI